MIYQDDLQSDDWLARCVRSRLYELTVEYRAAEDSSPAGANRQ